MRSLPPWLAPAGLAAVFALSVGLPAVVAASLAPAGSRFSGFLLNATDGFSYLAKMRQGWEGGWLSQLPYSAQASRPAAFFLYQVFLGHVARWSGASLIGIYQASRISGALVLAAAVFRLSVVATESRDLRLRGMAVVLLGSGWGWIASGLGILAVDLSQPETTPFLSAVANAHFPLALAALCVWMSLLIRPPASPGYASALGAGLGVTLALVAPYALIPAAVTGAVALAARRADPELKSGEGPGMLALWLGLLAVLLVWVAYYLSVVSSDPILGAWNAQNQTPSPQPLAYVFAFLPLLIAAGFLAFPTAPPIPARTGRVLLVWILATAAVLYAPFSVQRRFVLGVFVPIGLLAVQGVAGLRIPAYFRNLLFAALLATTAPSHVLVLAAGLESVRSGRSGQVIPDEALAAYRWLAENAPEESLVLAGALAGNQIPAFASVRVIYGHPYETPYAPQALETVRRAFSGDLSPRDAARDWEGPVFVYYGEEERGLGSPAWLDDLELVYSQGGTQIFRDPASP